MSLLHLVPIYCGTHTELLRPLAQGLGQVFGCRVEQHPPRFDPEAAYDVARGQYNSRTLLVELLRTVPAAPVRILGVTSVDLFIPVLTFVFGEAQLDGRAAVVSFHRLNNTVYGLPANPDLLRERLLKEAIHELGHTFNLLHCHVNRCVMTSSSTVDAVDLKSDRFCMACRAQIRPDSTRSARK